MDQVQSYVTISLSAEEPSELHGENTCEDIGLHSDIVQIILTFLYKVQSFSADQSLHRMTGWLHLLEFAWWFKILKYSVIVWWRPGAPLMNMDKL